MKHYLFFRILLFILVITGVSILSFTLIGFFGNDPAEYIARRTNINATHEQIEAVRESMGLNKPLPVRFLEWMKGLFCGDVGISIYSFRPIMQDVERYLPVSLILVGLALTWVILISVPTSILSALHPGSITDQTVRIGSVIGLCFPTFWLGFLLLIAFAVRHKIFTVVPSPGIKGYILPSFALSVPVISGVVRVFRSSLLKEMNSDYALFARSSGLSRRRVLTHHAFRNALPPVVTMFCQYLGYLIAGGAVVENVFTLNGLGTYLVGCVSASDSTAVATCSVIIAAIFVIANLAGDCLNRLLCPWMVREFNG